MILCRLLNASGCHGGLLIGSSRGYTQGNNALNRECHCISGAKAYEFTLRVRIGFIRFEIARHPFVGT